MANFHHIPVLLSELIDALNIKVGGVYVDCTLGGGGHAEAVLSRIGPSGTLIGIDRDPAAIAVAQARLADKPGRFIAAHSNYVEVGNIIESCGYHEVDGIYFDLGVSSFQLDTAERGFSYHSEARLDMRMNPSDPVSAYEVVNEYPEEELRRIIFEYGEERWAQRIAEFIVAARKQAPLETTTQLVEVIKQAIPAKARREGPHPARRTFQALRIEVNGELKAIAPAIRSAVEHLRPGGRIAVITFHSLEDRIVKKTFQELAEGCTCPKDLPVCVCQKKPQIVSITKHPMVASAQEVSRNPRSRSAKLRVAERLLGSRE